MYTACIVYGNYKGRKAGNEAIFSSDITSYCMLKTSAASVNSLPPGSHHNRILQTLRNEGPGTLLPNVEMASLSRGEDWQSSPVDFLSTLNMSENTLAAPVGAFNIWDPKSNLWIPLKLFTVYTTALFPNFFSFVLQLCFITYLLMSWCLLQSGDHEEIGYASVNTLYQTEPETKFLSALTSVRNKAGKSDQ